MHARPDNEEGLTDCSWQKAGLADKDGASCPAKCRRVSKCDVFSLVGAGQARFHAEARRQRRQIGVAKVAKWLGSGFRPLMQDTSREAGKHPTYVRS